MQPGALRTLEFDRIVEAVGTLAVTPTGAARLAELRPQTDAARVAHLLAATTETVRYLSSNPLFPLRAPAELDAVLRLLAVQGRALESQGLLNLAEYLESIELTRTAIRKVASQFPVLRALAESAASFSSETADVRRKIETSGEIVDQASTELAGIRERLRKQRARLRGTLESYLRSKESSRYLQEQVVTERNGRYVLVVKAEHRSAIPGIIHGSSASGASLFLEPLSTVEINNDIVALEQQEAAEIHRILLALTDAFRRRAGELHRTVEAATDLDVLQAKARFADAMQGIEPQISSDASFELLGATHPLLMRAVVSRLDARDAEHLPEPVPIDVKMRPPVSVLVITGPNTGGKTVALKTAGLLALMAQAGLHIPAAHGSRLPVFRSIFADIGDEQSIEASLSTFSAHISNITMMDRDFSLPALVLLDEIGAGTDPIEGGALGVAIVDHFKGRGALVVGTTHYDALKTYAATTSGVAVAAFGFAPDTFAPTYKLIYGSPGRSLALEIARRLGLSATIVDAAGQHVTAREAQLAEHLARIDDDIRKLDHERRLVARERETIAELESRIKTRDESLRQREEVARQRLNDDLDQRRRAARLEIDSIIGDMKRRAEEAAAHAGRRPTEPAMELGEVRAEARGAVDAIVERLREGQAPSAPEARHEPATVGDRVSVGTLGLEGRVVGVHDGQAEVDVRGKRLRASLSDLHVLAGSNDGGSAPSRGTVTIQLQPHERTQELNVVGCTVDEALSRAEKFLDETLLTDERTVRVIHGYGTGQLRRALAGFLAQHPLVAKFEAARPGEGGGGVTVVELKD